MSGPASSRAAGASTRVRARALARRVLELADQAGTRLPSGLALWALAGESEEARLGRRDGATRTLPSALRSDDAWSAAWEVVGAMEAELTAAERRRGAHYTPGELARQMARAALPEDGRSGPVADPACGAGALLLAAAERLVALGADREHVARDLLFGADVDPLAVAAAEVAITIWSGGVAPDVGHLVAGDALLAGGALWPGADRDGFVAILGNPPFQGQLSRATARSRATVEALRARFGDLVGPYVDTAAVFLVLGLELAAPGARVVMVQPQSTAAARDAAPIREALAQRSRLVELWAPEGRPFAARVHVCIPVLEVGEGDGRSSWSAHLATARGVPAVALSAPSERVTETLAERARVVGSFRDHYYGLVGHVRDVAADQPAPHPLITAGSLGIGHASWARAPLRFAKRRWQRPVVDVAAVRAASRRLDGWLDVVLAPKVVVATQTKVVEAAADRAGCWVPCTPTVSIVPDDPGDLARILAAVCSPPASAWLATRAAGSALGADAIRISRSMLEELPLPSHTAAWDEAAEALGAHDLEAFGRAAVAMYGLGPSDGEEVLRWWLPRARSAWPSAEPLR